MKKNKQDQKKLEEKKQLKKKITSLENKIESLGEKLEHSEINCARLDRKKFEILAEKHAWETIARDLIKVFGSQGRQSTDWDKLK